ncbi:phenylalanyl-tRNA synthetase subunit beta [Peptostreptococcus sp. MV1]|uniref:phenylalanine--tRNA ligase subunit beta n=1 Tax=Peptostreptococcus sp. MV1 TaxID=1219626 RepID=UPI00050E31F7|nr:phenylalanine--tRNA ligase subunit beta [Peptostreptococcus sp. MV1]KGF14990.1 phenylalanyl-tRNA synthetase subunit beta [Peptostreptococcus sp. MV1]
MLVSLKWLRDYVDIDLDAQTFGDKMTMTGTKTETVEYYGQEISNVVVGKILKIEDHPDADKLVVTQVDVGQDQPIQIVTAAKNVSEGDYIPLALHGSKLSGGLSIKKGKLRGVESNGMMCSCKELGIDEKFVEDYKKNGIYLLDMEDSYTPGMDIKEVLGLNDAVIDFELTSNRPDCRCMIGIAREAAVTLGTKTKYPEISVKEESDKAIDVDIQIENPDLCYRYLARRITDVKIEKSPYWMQRKLIEAGVRPINNIVDITNFVMLEMGQPMHAFDMREIGNNKIVVKNAKEGQVFTTLDEQERKLDSEMLMITNGEKNLGIAGIMGGLDSGIKDDTVEIMFESAVFNRENIRKSSKKLGLRSEASSRFEKGVSLDNAELALERAAQLVEALGAGKVMKGKVDVYPQVKPVQTITVSPRRINARVGVDIPMDKFCSILEELEFKCNLVSEDELILEVPSFRLDIEQEADIFEEIARIYGFENIPSVQLQGNSTAGVKTDKQKYLEKVKDTAIACGLYEILTYSFVSPKGLDKIRVSQDSKLRDVVKLINPLGEDTSIMRTTLIPNMLDVLYTNASRNIDQAATFECGHVFTPDDMAGVEETRICIGMYGDDVDFFVLKGLVEKIFERVGLGGHKYIADGENTSFHPGRCADILCDNKYLGTIGEVHPQVLSNYGIGKRVYIAEIDLDTVYSLANDTIIFKSLPKYPAITRDIALVVEDKVEVASIEEVIMDNAGGLVEACRLFDVYKGDQIGQGYKSVAYSIVYRSLEKTLTDDDVVAVHDKILAQLKVRLGAELR